MSPLMLLLIAAICLGGLALLVGIGSAQLAHRETLYRQKCEEE